MNKKKRNLIILTVVWICVIWGHSLMNGELSSSESGFVLSLVEKIVSASATEFLIRKLGHFSEFFVLGILLKKDFGEVTNSIAKTIFTPACAAFFVAFLDETIQLLVEGRAGMIQDVWIDFSGAIVAIILTYVIIEIRKRKHAE